MLTVYNCIVKAHDLSLVLLAVVICGLASFAGINLLRHARASNQMRNIWLVVAAISTGSGIWATHFIAMLAFTPSVPSGYNIILTIGSLILAILLAAAGLTLSIIPNNPVVAWLGGAIVGGSIALMHYTGMAAFEIKGIVLWDNMLVSASIALGALIGATALPAGLHGHSVKWKLYGALLLTLAIMTHHFTAMSAVSIVPDPTIAISHLAIPTRWLAIGVAVASFTIILLALASVWLDIRDRRRAKLESNRMQSLADVAVEGLVLTNDNDIITTALAG